MLYTEKLKRSEKEADKNVSTRRVYYEIQIQQMIFEIETEYLYDDLSKAIKNSSLSKLEFFQHWTSFIINFHKHDLSRVV